MRQKREISGKKNSSNVISPSYFLFSLSLSLFLFNKSSPKKVLEKRQSSVFNRSKKKYLGSSPFQNANPQRFQRPLIPSSRSHVWIPFTSHDFHVKCIERHMGCVPPRTQTPTSGWGKERFPWDCDSRQRLGRGALRLLAVELSRKRHLQM